MLCLSLQKNWKNVSFCILQSTRSPLLESIPHRALQVLAIILIIIELEQNRIDYTNKQFEPFFRASIVCVDFFCSKTASHPLWAYTGPIQINFPVKMSSNSICINLLRFNICKTKRKTHFKPFPSCKMHLFLKLYSLFFATVSEPLYDLPK